jgi:hypothetical protein
MAFGTRFLRQLLFVSFRIWSQICHALCASFSGLQMPKPMEDLQRTCRHAHVAVASNAADEDAKYDHEPTAAYNIPVRNHGTELIRDTWTVQLFSDPQHP